MKRAPDAAIREPQAVFPADIIAVLVEVPSKPVGISKWIPACAGMTLSANRLSAKSLVGFQRRSLKLCRHCVSDSRYR